MRGQIALAVARELVPEIVRAVRARPATAKADEITAAVLPAVEKAVAAAVPPDATVAPVKPAMASKINWVAGASAVIYALAAVGIVIPEEARESVQTLVALGAPVLIMALRTFFTRAITRGSAR